MRIITRIVAAIALAGVLGSVAIAMAAGAAPDLAALSRIPAVSGYEQTLAGAIQHELAAQGLHPNTDNFHDVWATVGSGSPHRLIVAAIDQPGYVVSGITPQGYLRVQRLPQLEPNAVFDTLSFAQPAFVQTPDAELNAVFEGLSIHLSPGRLDPPDMSHIDELYLDVGARSAAEARAAGADVLDPVSLAQQPITVGTDDEAGAGAGDRFGWEALLEVARGLGRTHASGTTTIAFVTQQWLGGRGLIRLLTELPAADEMILVGRVTPQSPGDAAADPTATPTPGDGVLIGSDGPQTGDLAASLQSLAARHHIAYRALAASPPAIAGLAAAPALPHRLAALGVPTLLPVTPAETFSRADLRGLTGLLEAYLREPVLRMSAGDDPFDASRQSAGYERLAAGEQQAAIASPTIATLKALTLAYGASGHEEGVRQAVLAQLPEWARRQTKTDAAGNLVLSMGALGRGGHDLVFDAHLDEIGYQVTRIDGDGRLQVKQVGGFYSSYYLGHVTLVHTSGGHAVGGVMGLPQGWDHPDFKWPPPASMRKEAAYVYVGTRSEKETEKLGIRVGDYLTIPKAFHPLVGSMLSVHSLDDRVGCTALVAAVRALGPDFARKWPGRRVTFVWTTGEEVGLDGAMAYAATIAKEGRAPDAVFAIDTFVSSDSPLETQRFADAVVGQGFVIRAVDNSNIDPPADVVRAIKIARDHQIPVQWGATNGGNDGAAYTRYGTVDIALGWPGIYSHSPVETVSSHDVAALSRMTETLATAW